MDEELMLKCLIALILGYFVARMFRGNGFSVGAGAPGPDCSTFKDASSCISDGCLYKNGKCYNPATCNSEQLVGPPYGVARKELSEQHYCDSLTYEAGVGTNITHDQAAIEINKWYQNPCIFESCATPCEISENTQGKDGKYMPTYKVDPGSWGPQGYYWTAKPKDCCDKINHNLLETGCRTPTICADIVKEINCGKESGCEWRKYYSPTTGASEKCTPKPSESYKSSE